jgi:hypothetical protein
MAEKMVMQINLVFLNGDVNKWGMLYGTVMISAKKEC